MLDRVAFIVLEFILNLWGKVHVVSKDFYLYENFYHLIV